MSQKFAAKRTVVFLVGGLFTVLTLRFSVSPVLAQAPAQYDICAITTDADAYSACTACYNSNGIYTALGCISFDPVSFVSNLLELALGVAGGLALLLMLYGAFTLISSGGDPKRTGQAKEIIGGAIGGLLFIIFSVVILQIVGVDILQLPGL